MPGVAQWTAESRQEHCGQKRLSFLLAGMQWTPFGKSSRPCNSFSATQDPKMQSHAKNLLLQTRLPIPPSLHVCIIRLHCCRDTIRLRIISTYLVSSHCDIPLNIFSRRPQVPDVGKYVDGIMEVYNTRIAEHSLVHQPKTDGFKIWILVSD
jgi:hypothetical protein